MFDKAYYSALGLGETRDKVLAGERLGLDEGERLFACPDIHALGALAMHARCRLHGNRAHYVVNRHINYTNICVNRCRFCAFSRRRAEDEGAFLLSRQDILDKVAAHAAEGASEVHIVGGCHPGLRLDFFSGLVRELKALFPGLGVKGFTVVEIAHFAALEGISTRETLMRLREAGLDMLPGGGAEIFAPHVRRRLCPEKIDGAAWLRIAAEAHGLGIRSNATMLFGHLESHRDRLEHLDALRQLQDETGGFVCFIPLPYLARDNDLDVPPERVGEHTGLDQLRTVAVSRLMLDNVPHLKAYWVMLGVKQAQAALWYGADDLDGTVVEEKIGHMAGASSSQALGRAELEAMIRDAGFEPVRRDALFRPVDQPRAGRVER